MLKIIYTRPDGGLSVMTPAEGSRLVSKLVMPNGAVMLFDGSAILTLDAEAAKEWDKAGGGIPCPADHFFRKWPVEVEYIKWAETEAAFAERTAATHVPESATNVQIIDALKIPTDRTFRNAWKAGNKEVVFDLEKCKELHRETLRELRKPKLAALDVEYQKADEAGDVEAKRAIAAEKQKLRDVTADPAINKAKTPEELKTAIPDILK